MTTQVKGRIGGSNRVLSMHEAAQYLGQSYKWFAATYRERGIPRHYVGRLVKFRERDLESYLDRVRES